QFVSHKMDGPWDIKAQAYGVYLLTRMGETTTPYANRLVKQLEDSKQSQWKSNSEALFLAASYQLLESAPLAHKLLSAFDRSYTVAPNYDYYYDQAYRDALHFYLITEHFPEEAKNLSNHDYSILVSLLGTGHCNTFNAAHMFLALESLLKKNANLDLSK